MQTLLTALRPIMSTAFRAATASYPDETPIRIAVDTPTGPRRLIDLAELRAIWTAFESIEEAPKLETHGQPDPGLLLTSIELYSEAPAAIISPKKYRIIFYFRLGNETFDTALTFSENQSLASIIDVFSEYVPPLLP